MRHPATEPGWTGEEDPRAGEVAAFLRDHPGFLAERPELYRLLAPPRRLHGEQFADHMAAMLEAERAHASAMAERADGVLAAGRAAASLTDRVQEAVLALFRAPDAVECVAVELPAFLGLDAAALCVEGFLPGARTVPPGTIERSLGARAVVFRAGPDDARLLHAEAARLARHDALVRVPGEGPPALLALAARDPSVLNPAQGSGALTFLGRAVAAALGR